MRGISSVSLGLFDFDKLMILIYNKKRQFIRRSLDLCGQEESPGSEGYDSR